jgi:glycosyltransferase involved in cell wall biosynthesis
MDWRVIDLFQRTPNLHCVFLRNTVHGGPGATRNVGLKNSFNENILFLDADDLFIEETALE